MRVELQGKHISEYEIKDVEELLESANRQNKKTAKCCNKIEKDLENLRLIKTTLGHNDSSYQEIVYKLLGLPCVTFETDTRNLYIDLDELKSRLRKHVERLKML